jgi:hypothetical protein
VRDSNEDPNEIVAVPLSQIEREFLVAALDGYGGPAASTEEFAIAIGCKSFDELLVECQRMRDAVEAQLPLSRFDWSRALFVAELMLASDRVGMSWEWSIVTGTPDHAGIDLLRNLQSKLEKVTVVIGRQRDWGS